jgi:hypothetical protein
MRRRHVFTPVVDIMPCRIAPSTVLIAPPPTHAVSTHPAPGGAQIGAMDDTTGSVSTTLITGEPTPPPSTINC